MTKVLIASTIAPWKSNGHGELSWLKQGENRIQFALESGIEVDHFMALEVDARGLEPYERLITRMMEVDSSFIIWKFMLDDGLDTYDSINRLPRICAGRNFAQEYAQMHDHTHILFLDTDTKVPYDCIPKLLDVGRPITGGEVPNYGLRGHTIKYRHCPTCFALQMAGTPATHQCQALHSFSYPVEEHWNTAGFLLVSRPVFVKLRWRWDRYWHQRANGEWESLTDDPCYQQDAVDAGFGQTWVRKDVVGVHEEALVPVESREGREYVR